MGCFGICMISLFTVGSSVRLFHGPFLGVQSRAEAWDRAVEACTSGTAGVVIMVYGNFVNIVISLH